MYHQLFRLSAKSLNQIRRVGFTMDEHVVVTLGDGAIYTVVMSERDDGSVRTYYGITDSSKRRIMAISRGQAEQVRYSPHLRKVVTHAIVQRRVTAAQIEPEH